MARAWIRLRSKIRGTRNISTVWIKFRIGLADSELFFWTIIGTRITATVGAVGLSFFDQAQSGPYMGVGFLPTFARHGIFFDFVIKLRVFDPQSIDQKIDDH